MSMVGTGRSTRLISAKSAAKSISAARIPPWVCPTTGLATHSSRPTAFTSMASSSSFSTLSPSQLKYGLRAMMACTSSAVIATSLGCRVCFADHRGDARRHPFAVDLANGVHRHRRHEDHLSRVLIGRRVLQGVLLDVLFRQA